MIGRVWKIEPLRLKAWGLRCRYRAERARIRSRGLQILRNVAVGERKDGRFDSVLLCGSGVVLVGSGVAEEEGLEFRRLVDKACVGG
jgi:hypothetical protein